MVVGVCATRHGRGVGGYRAPGIRRGQRCVRSLQSPADGGASPGTWVPWGLPRLYATRFALAYPRGSWCDLLEGMKKQGAGWPPGCNFLDTAKVGLYANFLFISLFLGEKVISAPLVRMRSPVQIWIAAPQNPLFSAENNGFLFALGTFSRV